MRKIDRIILHCSATSRNIRIAHVRDWHLKRGFSDVGYHYFIGSDGLIEQGRPLEKVGAHTAGHNKDSIGICLNGLNLEDFTNGQINSLTLLLTLLKHIIPSATIHGHNEFNKDKECPVFDVEWVRAYWSGL